MDAVLNKQQVRNAYRRIAPVYDLWSACTEFRAHNICLEMAAIENGERLLEVAVGTGRLFVRLLDANPDGVNIGIDLSDAMLVKARQRAETCGHSNFEISTGDAYHLDAQDASFDVLSCAYMFDLIPERDFPVILAEFRRVLAPGGRMVLVNMTRGDKWYNAIWERVYRLSPALLGGCRAVELSGFVTAAGFEVRERRCVSQNTFPSEILACVAK